MLPDNFRESGFPLTAFRYIILSFRLTLFSVVLSANIGFIIKDYVSWNGGEALFTKHLTEKILGEGELDVVGCINSSNAEWGILEIDDYNGSMWEAIEKSYKFLKNLIL